MKNKKAYAQLVDMSKKTMLKTGSIPPILAVFGSNNNALVPLMDMPQDHESKVKMFHKFGQLVAEDKERAKAIGELQGVALATEAWMLKVKSKKETKLKKSIRKHKNKVEALFIVWKDLKGKSSQIKAFEIKRDKKGEIKSIDLSQDIKGKDKDGTMAESPLLEAFVYGMRTGENKSMAGNYSKNNLPN